MPLFCVKNLTNLTPPPKFVIRYNWAYTVHQSIQTYKQTQTKAYTKQTTKKQKQKQKPKTIKQKWFLN